MTPIPTGLDYWSVSILCLVNFNEALQGNILWPFLPFAVKHWGVPVPDVATYVGLLASAFFIGQAISTPLWGKAADTYGRRPALLVGLLGTCIGMLAFGFASSFSIALLSRFCTGALNGNVAVRRIVISALNGNDRRSTCLQPRRSRRRTWLRSRLETTWRLATPSSLSSGGLA